MNLIYIFRRRPTIWIRLLSLHVLNLNRPGSGLRRRTIAFHVF